MTHHQVLPDPTVGFQLHSRTFIGYNRYHSTAGGWIAWGTIWSIYKTILIQDEPDNDADQLLNSANNLQAWLEANEIDSKGEEGDHTMEDFW